ncbi:MULTISPECIES: NADP-dependent oxidoreductase [unclassified Methylobacterium]|jgi:NADPH:quinone reductase-like Zn-dependent oxidoreductase|uniref:NADP-dependent oxidoreductase n=1 Tax=unclassified Methylobacterium TaxID=2615210 RepID=UPI0013550B1A|nr:NADP-dependent oxidoreductase [Methylobacterium sp. 2A]MWV25499.1 NADP-dependent oxidoreductase [Methylobacterium sp. 2A]
MSKRIVYHQYGNPDVLHLDDEIVASPGRDQVLVRNELIGVNPIDWKLVAGFFQRTDPAPFPGTPGWASTGIIEAVGAGVTAFSVGQAVIVDSRARLAVTSGSRAGTFRQYLVVDTRQIVPRPPEVGVEQAAGLPSSAVAGYSMIHHLGVTEDDTVLVHGAAGGVGSAAVQVAVARGARVVGTASPDNHDYLRSLGAHPIDYRADIVNAVRAFGPITASADAVGGAASVSATVALLPLGGRAVTAWGDAHSEAARIPWVAHPNDELHQVATLAARGQLTVRIADILPLADAAAALKRVKAGHNRGKILLRPE